MQKEVIAVADRNALLKKIGEISFTLDDLRLFLDTHPLDDNAIQLYQENITQRKQLLKQYSDEFEPLTTDCICLESNGSSNTCTKYPGQKHWTWNDGPVPWDLAANESAVIKGGV